MFPQSHMYAYESSFSAISDAEKAGVLPQSNIFSFGINSDTFYDDDSFQDLGSNIAPIQAAYPVQPPKTFQWQQPIYTSSNMLNSNNYQNKPYESFGFSANTPIYKAKQQAFGGELSHSSAFNKYSGYNNLNLKSSQNTNVSQNLNLSSNNIFSNHWSNNYATMDNNENIKSLSQHKLNSYKKLEKYKQGIKKQILNNKMCDQPHSLNSKRKIQHQNKQKGLLLFQNNNHKHEDIKPLFLGPKQSKSLAKKIQQQKSIMNFFTETTETTETDNEDLQQKTNKLDSFETNTVKLIQQQQFEDSDSEKNCSPHKDSLNLKEINKQQNLNDQLLLQKNSILQKLSDLQILKEEMNKNINSDSDFQSDSHSSSGSEENYNCNLLSDSNDLIDLNPLNEDKKTVFLWNEQSLLKSEQPINNFEKKWNILKTKNKVSQQHNIFENQQNENQQNLVISSLNGTTESNITVLQKTTKQSLLEKQKYSNKYKISNLMNLQMSKCQSKTKFTSLKEQEQKKTIHEKGEYIKPTNEQTNQQKNKITELEAKVKQLQSLNENYLLIIKNLSQTVKNLTSAPSVTSQQIKQ